MRISLVWALTFICTAPLLAQTKTTPKLNNSKPVTLVGCVQRNETALDQFTLFNPEDGAIYRLSGMKVGDFLGRRVQLARAHDEQHDAGRKDDVILQKWNAEIVEPRPAAER